ncbi:trimethylamine-N-oxide reductase TorA [Endozoicomonas sp. OPT23]|uniref:trimethylamine-N-oxide reductase TorA n=1 Tax=Endozoicomonas sp. OPT23 TaxID=2072845 RepID=UPI00129B4FE2|nr:trimethylamine-N-oxide reductase TorA [Endozoicomonas sp. OPT23]MRI32791.1 trimethylamine-N-oxide reductase TorA [Endozoicomonas sp. OPT23]
MSEASVSLSRRRFLGGMLKGSAAAMIGPSLLSGKAFAASGQVSEKTNATHWGAFRARVENGKLTTVRPFEKDSFPSKMLMGIRDDLYSPARVRYPMVRLDWLKKRHNSDTTQRGDNRFVRVSWDQALDFFYEELERVQKTHGPSGLYAGHTGWKANGSYHNCIAAMQRAVGLHGTFVKKVGDYSTGAAQVILPRVVGSTEVYSQQTSWPLVLENAKNIVFWGSDPIKNLQAGWSTPDHDVYGYYKQLKDKIASGAIRAISVDPVVSDTQAYLNTEHLPVNPQTDVSLMLGMAHTMFTEELYDEDFVYDYCEGFDKFTPYLTGESDGQPKSAEWASKICGIPADTIKTLARKFAKERTQFIGGWCVQRMHHGEQYAWMLVVLSAMTGQVGLPGGGFGFGWHYNGAGVPTRKSVKVSGFTGSAPNGKPKYDGDFGKYSSTIPVARFVDSMLEPGKTIDFNGRKVVLPAIKMAIFTGCNPFHHQQDRNKMVRAWQNLETTIAIDHHWTATCRFSDIVLPATTPYERNDIDGFGNHSRRGIIAMHKLIEPLFEARNDIDIFADLCKRFGQEKTFTEGRDEMEWLEHLYTQAQKNAKGKAIKMPTFEEFWNGDGYFEFDKASEKLWVRHADFREEPELEALGTPSGMIEIYSEEIAKLGYEDCPAHPVWMEPVERSHGGKGSDKYPLHMQSCHPRDRVHSQLNGAQGLRETYEVAGREPVYISPADAKARGIRNGDVVRVFNDRGQALTGAVISDRFRQGVIRIFEGAWYNPAEGGKVGSICKNGDPNVLTRDQRSSKLAQATSAHSALVQIEKYTGPALKVTAFDGPENVKA